MYNTVLLADFLCSRSRASSFICNLTLTPLSLTFILLFGSDLGFPMTLPSSPNFGLRSFLDKSDYTSSNPELSPGPYPGFMTPGYCSDSKLILSAADTRILLRGIHLNESLWTDMEHLRTWVSKGQDDKRKTVLQKKFTWGMEKVGEKIEDREKEKRQKAE